MKHRKDTDELWQEYVGTRSDESRNKLILAYRRLLRYCAQRLKMKLPVCVDQAELESEGVFGLIDAIEKFDPSRGTCFETYCIARIRGSMLDSLRASDWVPRAIRTKAHKLERAKNELAWELDREPTDREIARRMRLKLEEFGNLTKELQVKTQFSLEEPFDSEGSRQRIETMPDRRFPNPLDELAVKEVREFALRGLNKDERRVITLYYFENLTMKAIGGTMGVTESRICQIHGQAIQFLREKFAESA